MLPLKDVNPTRSFSIITFILILINVVVFFIEVFYNRELIIKNYGISFNKLFYLKDYKTLITHMFLHANFTHLFFNMLYLWIFGNNIEEKLGAFKFLLFYILGGIVASILQLLFIGDVNINLIGASGSVSAVLGAYLRLYPNAPILTLYFFFIFIGLTYIPAFIFIIFWFIFNLLNLFFNFYSNVAYLAHVVGFVFGFVFIDIFKNLFSFKTKKRRKYFH